MALPPNEIARVSEASPLWKTVFLHAVRRSFPKGAVIMQPEEAVNCLYYVEQGEVRMEAYSESLEKIYWFIGRDSIFGETPLFHHMPSRLSATCTQNSVVQIFSREVLHKNIFPHYPELVTDILKNMAVKIRLLTNQVSILSMGSTTVRVCKYLQMTVQKHKDGRTFVVPGMSQQKLASLLGMHRVTCNRILKELEQAGILSAYSSRCIWVYDEEAFLSL